LAGSADIEIAQRSVRGSLLLFIGNFLQTLISAAGIIVIARLLVPDDYGLFTLSFVIPNLILLLLGLGVNVAVTRFAAYYLSIGKPNEAKRFTRNAVLFLALFGIAFSALNYVSAGFLSSVLLRRPEISQFVQAISVFILGQALFQASIASLIGWNSMKLASASQVVQAILKIGFSVALVLAGFGVMGAVLGHAAAWLLAGGIATTALYIVRLGRPFGGLAAFSSDVKEMVRYGLPLYAGSLISGLASSYLVIILAAIASNTVVGYYAAANNVTVPIGLASSSIASALLPAFASLDGTG
jgi:O-antigen/teichoic acid export membrane protein